MNNVLLRILAKIDYKLSSKAYSRASYQVELIINKIKEIYDNRFLNLLDIGGGFDGRYRIILESLTYKYTNMEIEKGNNVDLVGNIYSIPLKSKIVDLITLFMVLEHLNDPIAALSECNRVLKKRGLIALTTVQYWHTHMYPNDYYRYTNNGLEYILKKTGYKILSIWSHGGPFLVIFHSIELNLKGYTRVIFSILFYSLFNLLDWVFFKHSDNRKDYDSVGWSVIAEKI